MKQRIFNTAFQLIVRFLLKLLSFAALTGKGIGFFIGRAKQALLAVGRFAVPAVLVLYFAARKVKARVAAAAAPLRGHAFYLLGHRYFVHGLIVLIVAVAAVPSIRAADRPPGDFGEATLLHEMVGGEEETVIDETLPAEELESYLEGRFQDEPPAPGETALPLTLDGGALTSPELPGTLVPATRTELVDYEVAPGDTLWDIAEKFGVNISTILWENGLNLYSTIRPGQKLAILPVSGVSHKVRKGDTLGAIAKRYGASADEIKQVNKLTDATPLEPGSKLVIPGGRPYAEPLAKRAPRREIVIPPNLIASPGGKLLWPTAGRRITQYFKWRHAGLDIGGRNGEDPIYAAENGVVEYSGWGRGGWGNTIVVNHGNGLKTRYAHATKLLVGAGDEVKKGEVIAIVGSTGRSTGPHLHFGVYVNGRSINPLEYLR